MSTASVTLTGEQLDAHLKRLGASELRNEVMQDALEQILTGDWDTPGGVARIQIIAFNALKVLDPDASEEAIFVPRRPLGL